MKYYNLFFLYLFCVVQASEHSPIITQLTSSDFNYNFEDTPEQYFETWAKIINTKTADTRDKDAQLIALTLDYCFREIIHKPWPNDFIKLVEDKGFLERFNCSKYASEFEILKSDIRTAETYLSMYKNFAIYTLINDTETKERASNYLSELFYKRLNVNDIYELSKLYDSLLLKLINHITLDSIKNVFNSVNKRKQATQNKAKKELALKTLQAIKNLVEKLSKPGKQELVIYMDQTLQEQDIFSSQLLTNFNKDLLALGHHSYYYAKTII